MLPFAISMNMLWDCKREVHVYMIREGQNNSLRVCKDFVHMSRKFEGFDSASSRQQIVKYTEAFKESG